jgi:hypothetical protein
MTWAARLAALSEAKHPMSLVPIVSLAFQNDTNDTIGKGVFSAKPGATDPSARLRCARCGTPSPPFSVVVNPDLWQCAACLPAEPVLFALPVSWADTSLVPTPGARCRCCRGRAWWTEATSPRGWRCSTCHPADHLPPERRREVAT